MVNSPVRQITPPISRVWIYGVLATLLSILVNYGLLWLFGNLFEIELLVPKGIWNSDLTLVTPTRVIIVTMLAGLFATIGATALSKLVIGPRTWCLILGFGFGLTSTYGAITLPNVSVSVHVALSALHIFTTFTIVPILALALTIHDSDLAVADERYHEHLDSLEEDVKPLANVEQAQVNETPIAQEAQTASNPESPLLGEFHPSRPSPFSRSGKFHSSVLLGTSEPEAVEAILEAGLNYRIALRDGLPGSPAGEPDENRITLVVKNGIVTSARPG